MVLLRDAEKLEARSQRAILDQTDVRMFHAIGLLTAAEAEQFLGRPPDLTWEKLVQKYEKYSATHCRPNTHRENMRRARQLVDHLTRRGITPEVVTTEDTEDWKAERKRAGVSNRTVNIELNILWQLLDGAFEDGRNPARRVGKLDSAKMARLPRALTPEEDEAVMRLIWEDRGLLAGQLWWMYLLYRFGGLRRDEARLLPWVHVLEDRVLIQEVKLEEHELSRIDEFDQDTWRPKERDARAVPLPKWVMEELRTMPRTSRLVFSEHGRAFLPSTITRAFKRILKKVAPELTLHDLRHTYITEQMENGVPPARVQRLAGHKLLSTTERYTHIAIEARVRNLEQAYRSIPDREALVRTVGTGYPPTM
ncbi:MAG: tyrosine-type recombinase/integrase [bacterium]|nr:tyrosine-type recombinase/integrase [bacterium]